MGALRRAGFLVIATPLRLGPGGLFDHRGLATTCAKDFAAAWPFVEERYGASAATSLRIFGVRSVVIAQLILLFIEYDGFLCVPCCVLTMPSGP